MLGCSGDSHCGGDDITNTILKEVISAFEGIFHKDPRSSPADMMLHLECSGRGKEGIE